MDSVRAESVAGVKERTGEGVLDGVSRSLFWPAGREEPRAFNKRRAFGRDGAADV
jgi:hypothetical protein